RLRSVETVGRGVRIEGFQEVLRPSGCLPDERSRKYTLLVPFHPAVKLQRHELDYLAAWATEERAPDPYALPAHQLQAAHGVKGVILIRLIKAWARAEGRRDEDIFNLPHDPNPVWPWPDDEQLGARLDQEATSRGQATRSSG